MTYKAKGKLSCNNKEADLTRLIALMTLGVKQGMPLVPGFIGCGLLTGLLNIVIKIDPALAQNAIIQMLAIAGNAVFWGMNLFVGINTAKEFGGSPIIGGVMGVVVTHPGLSTITLFGSKLLPGRGGIIAVILVVIFASYLEKRLHKLVPVMLDLFLTPFLTIGISALIAICVLQPVGGMISEQIGFLATTAVEKGGAFTGFILGGIWLPMDYLAITRLDILDKMAKIKMCVGYEIDGKPIANIPADLKILAKAKPVYEEFTGWQQDISGIKTYDELPAAARKYVERLSEVVGVKIGIVSVGPNRAQTIVLKELF